jgi:hypothetical protein
MFGVALKSPQSEETKQIIAKMQDFIPYVDVMEASVYPYVFFNMKTAEYFKVFTIEKIR